MGQARTAAGCDDKAEAWRLAGESARAALLAVARHGGAAALTAAVMEGAAAAHGALGEVARCLREEGLLPPGEGEVAAATPTPPEPAPSVSMAPAAAAAPLRCAVCGASSGELLLCSGCHGVRYCGRDCQKADWRAHKAACRRVQDEQRQQDQGQQQQQQQQQA